MRVLVTGAQGCIGAWVVRKLLDRGIDTVTYDLDAGTPRLSLLATPEELSQVRQLVGGIEDTERVKAVVRDHSITHIVHLAAVLMPFCQQNPVQGGMINVIGTLNVFEAARDAGSPVRIVYASSSAIWGPEEFYGERNLSERDSAQPGTHYGVFKYANEQNARVFHAANGISSIGFRPWAVYGPGRDQGLTGDPTLALRAVVRGEPYKIRLSGFIDLQYVEDVAEIFLAGLFSPLDGAHVFNLAGDVIRLDPDYIDLLEELRPGARSLITAQGPQVPVAYKMDDTELRTHLPGIPRTALHEGIRKTLTLFERWHAEGRL